MASPFPYSGLPEGARPVLRAVRKAAGISSFGRPYKPSPTQAEENWFFMARLTFANARKALWTALRVSTLYSPSSMDAKRTAFLGRVLQWGKANWEILSHTQMILGAPRKGEIYGYSHARRGATIVFLRNPGLESKEITLTCKDLACPPQPDGTKEPALAEAHEICPAFYQLDWEGTPAAPVKLRLLGSETKCIVLLSDRGLLERLKL